MMNWFKPTKNARGIVLATVVLCSFVMATRAPAAEKTSENTALIPKPKLEQDSYDWYARHEEVLKVQKEIQPEVVMIGDSITHFWAGRPAAQRQSGVNAWKWLFGDRPVLNMGFGWDRTQNVLWRLEHGEFDGLHPKYVVLNIGTNNLTGTNHARTNTPAEIAEAIGVICDRIHEKSPQTKIIIMGVFPRGEKPDDPIRKPIIALNKLLPDVAKAHQADFLDIGQKFLAPDGTIPNSMMFDFCHPAEKGYAIWAEALKPRLAN
jgi:lysophospholipase L1-like esterase